jgi:HEAT repeat protein
MAKRDTTQEALDRLRELEAEEPSDDGMGEIRAFLKHRVNHVAGRAAEVAEVWQAEALIPDLEQAFHRFLKNPVKTDPMCAAKLPMAKCLQKLDYASPDLLLVGVRHVQMEPVWGEPEDTAPGLRGACGRALAAMHYPEAYLELARLLMDSEPEARRSAVDTLRWLAGPESELLLRTKVLAGDAELDIEASCLHALTAMEPERSLAFVAEYLDSASELMAGAALALGESKHPEAFPYLREAWERAELETHRQALLLPLALHRSEEAFVLLMEVLQDARAETAAAAVNALGLYTRDADRAESVRQAVAARSEPAVREAFDAAFGD